MKFERAEESDTRRVVARMARQNGFTLVSVLLVLTLQLVNGEPDTTAIKSFIDSRNPPATAFAFELESAEPDVGLQILSELDSHVCTIEKRTALTAEEFER